MSSPASEIVVSQGPPPESHDEETELHHAQDLDREASLSPLSPPPAILTDPNSKKSFKRKYRKLLNKYLAVRATNQALHASLQKATQTAAQFSNEIAFILDLLVELNPDEPPQSPKLPEDIDLGEIPEPSEFTYDPHYGYTPSPSPEPEIANQLTKEQIEMGMYKVEPGQGLPQGAMGPPAVPQEEAVDSFKNRGSRTKPPAVPPPPNRKRKERESDVELGSGSTGRKKSRGQ